VPPLESPARRPPQRIAAGRTVVEFTWDGDRWRHSVTVADRLVADSVEGGVDTAADPRWPASPVLVEVSLAGPADRPALLAVGLAGRSHFAASVAGAAEPDTLLFEIACRLHEPPIWLGSTYRTGPDPADIVRIPAPALDGTLPATLRWTYTIGPRGLLAMESLPRPTPGGGGR
jgi:hypothetical protein